MYVLVRSEDFNDKNSVLFPTPSAPTTSEKAPVVVRARGDTTASANQPPNLDPPKVPRNMLTNFAYFTISPPLILARRLKGKSYHKGWSFRNEHSTGWLKYTLGSGDYKAWRRLMSMAGIMGRVKATAVSIEKVKTPNVRAYWVGLNGHVPSKDDWTILYFHGGGYLTGTPLMHAFPYQKLLLNLKKEHNVENVRIFAVQYPLAPENPYPAQLNAAIDAYKYLTETSGYDSSKILLGGDSAGGNLSLVLTQRLRELGLSMPNGLVLISPWVELITELPPHARKADTRRDYLSPRCAKEFVGNYIQDSGVDLTDPMVSPIYADMTGFPPMMVCWGGVELFREQIGDFVQKAKEAKVEVTEYMDPDMPHVFTMLFDFYPKNAKIGLKHISDWVANRILRC